MYSTTVSQAVVNMAYISHFSPNSWIPRYLSKWRLVIIALDIIFWWWSVTLLQVKRKVEHMLFPCMQWVCLHNDIDNGRTKMQLFLTSHERHVVPNHRLFDSLFNSLCGPHQRNTKVRITGPLKLTIFDNQRQFKFMASDYPWTFLSWGWNNRNILSFENAWPACYAYYQHYSQCLSLYSRVGRKRQRFYTYHTWQQSYRLYTYFFCRGSDGCVSKNIYRNWWIPHTKAWRGALMFSLICAWIDGWVNNGEAGDMRRHHAHYDVTVM